MSLIDNYLVSTQRKRASYEILEVEYKEKSLFLDYYIDIGSHLVKFIKENPTKRIDKETNNLIMMPSVEEKIYEEIVNYTKEKHKEYKIKYTVLKEQKLNLVSIYIYYLKNIFKIKQIFFCFRHHVYNF